MKSAKADSISRPFEGLEKLLAKRLGLTKNATRNAIEKPANCRHSRPSRIPDRTANRPIDPENEDRIFKQAMADVTPLCRENCLEKSGSTRSPHSLHPSSEENALIELKELVRYGKGFVVSQTPEYIEGLGYGAVPELTRRLHQGGFSIQAHVDLHGLGVIEARDTVDKFLKNAVATGKRAVLIVHGRGLCSPVKPVLKTRVYQWLTTGQWRKWVIAFTSARSCDGGAGATYVLLRYRPLSGGFLKKAVVAGSQGKNSKA